MVALPSQRSHGCKGAHQEAKLGSGSESWQIQPMSALAIHLPEELDATLAEGAKTSGARSKEGYLLNLVESDCAAGNLESILIERMAGPFGPLETGLEGSRTDLEGCVGFCRGDFSAVPAGLGTLCLAMQGMNPLPIVWWSLRDFKTSALARPPASCWIETISHSSISASKLTLMERCMG